MGTNNLLSPYPVHTHSDNQLSEGKMSWPINFTDITESPWQEIIGLGGSPFVRGATNYVYRFLATGTRAVAQPTQMKSILGSVSFSPAHWFFGIWIPSTQRAIFFAPNLATSVSTNLQISFALNIDAPGVAEIDLYFAQITGGGPVSPVGSFNAQNYSVNDFLSITTIP